MQVAQSEHVYPPDGSLTGRTRLRGREGLDARRGAEEVTFYKDPSCQLRLVFSAWTVTVFSISSHRCCYCVARVDDIGSLYKLYVAVFPGRLVDNAPCTQFAARCASKFVSIPQSRQVLSLHQMDVRKQEARREAIMRCAHVHF